MSEYWERRWNASYGSDWGDAWNGNIDDFVTGGNNEIYDSTVALAQATGIDPLSLPVSINERFGLETNAAENAYGEMVALTTEVAKVNNLANEIANADLRIAYVTNMQTYFNSNKSDRTALAQANTALTLNKLGQDFTNSPDFKAYKSSDGLNSAAFASLVNTIQSQVGLSRDDAMIVVSNLAYATNPTGIAANQTPQTNPDYANITGTANATPQVAGEVFVGASENSIQANMLRNQLNQQFDQQRLGGPNAGSIDENSIETNSVNSPTTNPIVLADDNFVMTMDLSIGRKEAAEQNIGHKISYSEFVIYQAFSEYFVRRGLAVPSGSEMGKLLAEAISSGKYKLTKDGKTYSDTDLENIVKTNGQLIFRDVQVYLSKIIETLQAAGVDPQKFHPNVGTVNVTGSGNNGTIPVSSGGGVNGGFTPRPIVDASTITLGLGAAGTAITGGAALSTEFILLQRVAENLAKTGAISGEVLGMVTTAIAELGLPFAALAGSWVAVFDKILDIAALKAMDEARRTAVANEVATLAVEIARQTDEAIRLANVTALPMAAGKPTDYANPPKINVSPIPNANDVPAGETSLAPTTGTNLAPSSPSEEPKGTPPSNPTPSPNTPKPPPDLEKIFAAIKAKLGPITSFVLTTVLGNVIVNSVRGTDNQVSTEDSQRLADLANRRTQETMPESKYDAETGTLASITINGETVYGHNTTLERDTYDGFDNLDLRLNLLGELKLKGLLPPDAKYGEWNSTLFLTHAEVEALLEARKKFGSLEGKEIKIYVDRRTCEQCYEGLPKIMAAWGIKQIVIISSGETIAGKRKEEIVVIKNEATLPK